MFGRQSEFLSRAIIHRLQEKINAEVWVNWLVTFHLTFAPSRRIVPLLRATARSELAKSGFFRAFHPKQLDSYVEAGLRPLVAPSTPQEDTRQTLACPRWAETLIFADPDFMLPSVWRRLRSGQRVGPRCRAVRWVEVGKDWV